MDGSYYAEDRTVWRRAIERENGVSIGFPVCEVSYFVNEASAKIIAEALNEHRIAHPDRHDRSDKLKPSDSDGVGQSDGQFAADPIGS